MKKPQGPIPMSTNRFFNTVNYQHKTLINEKLEEVKASLTLDNKKEMFIHKLDYSVYNTINQLAKEILIKEGLMSETDELSPECHLSFGQMNWTYNYKGNSFNTYQSCSTFTYTKPFEASFTYLGYGGEDRTFIYNQIINNFSAKVIKTFNRHSN